MTEKLLTPNNMAAILLVLTFWLPGLFLPEGTTIDLGMDDSPKKMKELDLTTVEMPDIQKQSTKEIIDRCDPKAFVIVSETKEVYGEGPRTFQCHL